MLGEFQEDLQCPESEAVLASWLGRNLIGALAQAGKEEGRGGSSLYLKGGKGWILTQSKTSSCLNFPVVMHTTVPGLLLLLGSF